MNQRRWLIVGPSGGEYVTADEPRARLSRITGAHVVELTEKRDESTAEREHRLTHEAISERAPDLGGGSLRRRVESLLDRYEVRGVQIQGLEDRIRQLEAQNHALREQREASDLAAARRAIERYGTPPPGEGTHPLQRHRDSMG